MGGGNHPTSIAGGVLIAPIASSLAGSATDGGRRSALDDEQRPPVSVSAPRFFSHRQQVRDAWSRELLGHRLPVPLRARGRRCYSAISAFAGGIVRDWASVPAYRRTALIL